MEKAEPIIRVNDLHHTYLRNTPLEAVALHGVSMEIDSGDAVGIIGRTGSGKSTVVQHLNGLIRPREPGKVIVDGQDLSDPSLDLRKLRQKVGLVFQYPEDQLFERLVGDDIAFGPRQMGLSLEELRPRVKWAMEMVGLGFEEFKDRYTLSLSGGEMRKAAIAGVLALRPKVLILDESTSGMDPRSRKELLGRIRNLHEREGMTVILVSPNMEDIAELVNRIYVLADGKTVMTGSTREIFARREELRRYGLGVPQVTEVMHELRSQGQPVDVGVLNAEEAEQEIWKILNS
ncbi:MAG: energy-coupling factor transporter ATPase [Chloroflexi bacterium]|nr:energy-coupling factor transporter ATPase [Chloroflexota bacterium]